jgi:hypothetical protein
MERGVGIYPDEYVPPQPALSLSIVTPQVGQGYQSLKKNPSKTLSGEKRNPTVADLSQRKKKMKQGEGDGDISVGDEYDKDDKDIDFVAITDNAMVTVNQGAGTSGRDDIQWHKAPSSRSFYGKSISRRTWETTSCQSSSAKWFNEDLQTTSRAGL